MTGPVQHFHYSIELVLGKGTETRTEKLRANRFADIAPTGIEIVMSAVVPAGQRHETR